MFRTQVEAVAHSWKGPNRDRPVRNLAEFSADMRNVRLEQRTVALAIEAPSEIDQTGGRHYTAISRCEAVEESKFEPRQLNRLSGKGDMERIEIDRESLEDEVLRDYIGDPAGGSSVNRVKAQD